MSAQPLDSVSGAPGDQDVKPFRVQIAFTGMCLFVPRGESMHVMLPNMPASNSTHDRHVPLLLFDVAHLCQGSSAKSCIPVGLPLAGRDVQIQVRDIKCCLKVRPKIVNIRDTGNSPVQPSGPGPKVTSRIELCSGEMKSAGPYSKASTGVIPCWEWPPQRGPLRQIANLAVWEIAGIAGDRLPLRIRTKQGEVELSLYPTGSRDPVIELLVFHGTVSEILDPGDDAPPHVDSPARHFKHYYDLVDDPEKTCSPILRKINECPEPFDDRQVEPGVEVTGLSVFRCLLAGDF